MKIGLFSKIGFVKSPSPPLALLATARTGVFLQPPTQFAQIASDWSHHCHNYIKKI